MILDLTYDIQDKIFGYCLDNIEKDLDYIEDKLNDVEIITKIYKNDIAYEFEISYGDIYIEAVATGHFATCKYFDFENKLLTSYEIDNNLYDIIDTDKKIRLVVNTGKVYYNLNNKINYKDQYDNYYYISPIMNLTRYIDAYLLMIKIHKYSYTENESDKELLPSIIRIENIICIDDLDKEYEIKDEPDVRYYAIDYICN